MRPTARLRTTVAVTLVLVLAAGCAQSEPGPTAAGSPAPASAPASIPGSTRPTATDEAAPSGDAVIPSPAGDFYSVPDPLPPGEPGEVIWAERVAAPAGAIGWRVLYHSRSVGGADVAVSGLVVAPDRDAPPGGFPVLAYAHGTTGLADACAPSKGARAGTGAASLPVPALWEQGYVVAATDYEGLGTPGRHPYLVGESEARSVLDSVRAARALPVSAGSQTVAIGLSQGGHAALFTGEVAPVYAPDVELAGVVSLAPGAELLSAAQLLATDASLVGYAVAIGAGFAAAYPDADLERVLTPDAWRRIDVVDEGCMGEVLGAFAGPVRDVIRLERILEPPWPGLLEANTPGRVPTPAPVFVGQGTADPLVVPALTDALVERMCAIGDDVTYRRYRSAGHGGVATAAAADVEAWIRARLAGEPAAAGTCDR